MTEQEPGPDFRRDMVRGRLETIGRVVLVLSGKGGVGKSVLSASMSLVMAMAGYRVGLLDADLYGPSSALLLGAREKPVEEKTGLIPPTVSGVKVMSIDLVAPGIPLPLIGQGASDVILEMLALTEWGSLDFLVVDMPPSTGDILMTVIPLAASKVAAVVITTPDRLAASVTKRTIELLKSEKVPIVGLFLNNLSNAKGLDVGGTKLARKYKLAPLGPLPYDEQVRSAVEERSPGDLVKTRFAQQVKDSLLEPLNDLLQS